VLVDLSELKSYALFPGQLVLVQGINSSGRKLVAQRIYEGIPRPLSVSNPTQLRQYHHSSQYQHGRPLSVWMASGPFTTSDNLDYAPLNDLLYNVAESRPDVLVLIGPFVDISHPSLADGRVYLSVEDDDGVSQQPANYEAVFVQKIVRDGLEALFNTVPDLPTQIILVPHHEFVYPQPPFSDKEPVKNAFFEADLGVLHIPQTTGPNPRVHCLSNPCMFSVNEVVFGVTSNDVLLQLSAEEISMGAPSHRLARLASHMLNQQSFNPVFPPPANSLAQMDLKQHKHWQMPVTPDVLVLPSKLAQFARDVSGCLVVNPGQLAKGRTGGTFARMSMHPIPEEELIAFEQQQQDIPHQLVNRSSVEIVRI
jgi:DNA polymerase alpha subunit B